MAQQSAGQCDPCLVSGAGGSGPRGFLRGFTAHRMYGECGAGWGSRLLIVPWVQGGVGVLLAPAGMSSSGVDGPGSELRAELTKIIMEKW